MMSNNTTFKNGWNQSKDTLREPAMTTEQIRHNRQLAAEYLKKIPAERWYLNATMKESLGIQLYVNWEGLENSPQWAVGCVLGWLQTMPAVRDYAKKNHRWSPVIAEPSYRAVVTFLGLNLKDASNLFHRRSKPTLSDYAEAMERVDSLMSLPIMTDGVPKN